MDVEGFTKASPLGMGWLLGHISTKEAVAALANSSDLTEQEVRAKYRLDTKTSNKEEDPS